MGCLDGKVFPLNALPAAKAAGLGIDQISHNADLKAAAVVDFYRQVPADPMFVFSDIVIQAEAMGAEIAFAPAAMPTVAAPARTVLLPRAADVPRMRVNAEAFKALGRAFPGRGRVAMVYGPFTVAGQVAGEQNILRGTVKDPEGLHGLLDKCTLMALDYADLLLSAGAELLWVSDPLAALLPPVDFTEFAGQYLARIFGGHPQTPSALHICGDTTQIVPGMVATGVSAISFDQCLDLMTLEDLVPPEVTIVGNLDPVDLMELAGPEEVAKQSRDLALAMGALPNFALATGCAPPPSASPLNIKVMVEEGKKALAEIKPYAAKLARLGAMVFRGQRDGVAALVRELLAEGAEPMTIITAGLMRAVQKGSANYEAKRCHLPAILLMVDAFYDGYRVLESRLAQGGQAGPQVILGTVKGDIHEIGKNLVGIILEAHGLPTLDLGVNVAAEDFLAACQKHAAPVVGLSAFITSARKELSRTVELFAGQGPAGVKLMVGGAAVNQQLADSMGAAGYARDAMAAVKLVKGLLSRGRA